MQWTRLQNTQGEGRYAVLLDALFEDCGQLMWDLSAAEGQFTNYAFLRRATQRHQGAYVRLLALVLQERGEEYLFNLAHQYIGGRISTVARHHGYEQIKDSGITEVNIFGDSSPAILYRRTDATHP